MCRRLPASFLLVLISAASLARTGSTPSSDLPLEPARRVQFETAQVTWLSLDLAPAGDKLVIEVLGDLYTVPAAGGRAVPLTRGMAFDSQPRFSPDGTQVVFVSDRSGREALWVVPLDGRAPRALGAGEADTEFASPAWAPDGSHVLVSRTRWSLRTYELWAYPLDGGEGFRLTRSKPGDGTPTSQRHNALGAVYSPDGRYLYYARKLGGFGYNVRFPLWQIARRDLVTDDEVLLTGAYGSAFRPGLSPDGRLLVYGTRYRQQTGLRVRNLDTGDDRWLVYPTERDDQESRFTRDLLPGYAFAPDGATLFYSAGGEIHTVGVSPDGRPLESKHVPIVVGVDQPLGPRLSFPYRIGLGPVKARVIRDPAISPDGRKLAFSAFARLHVYDFDSGDIRTLGADDTWAFHPAWSPDGRYLVYVSWQPDGGHLWRVRADGRGGPKRLTRQPAFYSDPAYTPDGRRIVALRANRLDRLNREFDFGVPVGSEVVWLAADGGPTTTILPAGGLTRPHFGPDGDRVVLYTSRGTLPSGGTSWLVSVRIDGTDPQRILSVQGPGTYLSENGAPAADIRLGPDGRHALVQHANQLWLVALLNPHLRRLEVDLEDPGLPAVRLTDVGADFFGWAGDVVFWSVGNTLYRRPLDSIEFPIEHDVDSAEDGAERRTEGTAGTDPATVVDPVPAPPELAERHPGVRSTALEVYRARHEPEGTVALTGATVIPMDTPDRVIRDAIIVIRGDRIAAVGGAGEIPVPDEARQIDLSGRFVLPGYVDTHAHYRPSRRVLDAQNWSFLANLAYGVTTGLDVQPSTIDILAYQDLLDAGLMLGNRVLSTGPGVFSNNAFESAEHAEAVLRRYRDHYRVHNVKSYIAGNRQQRQWLLGAARTLELMPTAEGALDMKLDLTHVIDGYSGNEHNFPLVGLYGDVVRLVAESGIAYTPTLVVGFGGPWAASYYYTRESPAHDPKLERFIPHDVLAARTQRTSWFHDDEFVFHQFAEHADRIVRAGGRVGVGSHGQLQGLGYHWELWSLASGGMDPWHVLQAATRTGAEMIGIGRDVGTVAVGKLADLVILRSNPLEDIRRSTDIEMVVKGGEIYDADTLDRVWPDPAPLPHQWWWDLEPPSGRPRPR